MKNSFKISRLYAEEQMVEIGIEIATNNLSLTISCYTQTEKLHELNRLCVQYVEESKPFEWNIGSKEFSYFEMKVSLHDKHGYAKTDFVFLNKKDSTIYDNMYCECCLVLALGQIEALGERIIHLDIDDFEHIAT